MIERRKHRRYLVPTVAARVGDPKRSRARFIEDLSEGGILLRTQKPLPIRSQTTVQLVPPGWASALSLAGRVVRVSTKDHGDIKVPAGMGVEFVDLSDDKRTDLSRLLDEYGARAPVAAGEDATRPVAPQVLENEVQLLRRRLAEATGQVAGLHAELEKFEHHEKASRVLLSHLMAEQRRLQAIVLEAERERPLIQQNAELNALLEQKLANQLAEKAAAAVAEAQLTARALRAEERADELRHKFEAAQAELERTLAGEFLAAQHLLLELGEEYEELTRARTRIAQLEHNLRTFKAKFNPKVDAVYPHQRTGRNMPMRRVPALDELADSLPAPVVETPASASQGDPNPTAHTAGRRTASPSKDRANPPPPGRVTIDKASYDDLPAPVDDSTEHTPLGNQEDLPTPDDTNDDDPYGTPPDLEGSD